MNGKSVFYPKVRDSLIKAGYDYYDGDEDIIGKSRQHRRKPDYVAVKGNQIIIGEIKSPSELPISGSWRQQQPNDSQEFATVRQEGHDREKAGQVNPEVGGHEIIIKGQIPDYVSRLGVTYDLPAEISDGVIKGGYTVPAEQASNARQALKNSSKGKYLTIENGGHAVTFVFDL